MLTPSDAHHTRDSTGLRGPPRASAGLHGTAEVRPRGRPPASGASGHSERCRFLRAARRLPRDARWPLAALGRRPRHRRVLAPCTSRTCPARRRPSGRSASGEGKPADVPARPLPPAPPAASPDLVSLAPTGEGRQRRPLGVPLPGLRRSTAPCQRPSSPRPGPSPPSPPRPAARTARAPAACGRWRASGAGLRSGAPAPGGGWAWWPKRPAGRGAVVSPAGPPGPPGPSRRPSPASTTSRGPCDRCPAWAGGGSGAPIRRSPPAGPGRSRPSTPAPGAPGSSTDPRTWGTLREALAAVAAPRPGRRRDPPGGAQRPAGRRRRPLRRRLHRRDRPRRRRRSWPTWGPCTPR